MNPAELRTYLERIENGDERPFFGLTYRQLEAIFEKVKEGEQQADVVVLWMVFCEAQIRVAKNADSRSLDVFDRARERLEELDFEFPEDPSSVGGAEDLSSARDWPKVGVLKKMGYGVGSEDPGLARRRAILTNVFEESALPRVYSPEHMAQWGRARSVTRLNKMARTIWSFSTLRLRKLDGESDDCVAAWAEDLAWLKRTYYRDHFAFPWPEIYG